MFGEKGIVSERKLARGEGWCIYLVQVGQGLHDARYCFIVLTFFAILRRLLEEGKAEEGKDSGGICLFIVHCCYPSCSEDSGLAFGVGRIKVFALFLSKVV